MSDTPFSIVILGAGPAGLAAALQLARRKEFKVTVLERHNQVGGNAGSFELEGLPVDYGSHRLHPACPANVLADIQEMLGPELLDRPRHGRIRLRNRWLRFPLKAANLARNLPLGFTFGTLWDMVRKPPQRNGHENFATVLERGLGRTICRDFYFPYAEKIWGLTPPELDVEQAKRRVSAGSFAKLLWKVASLLPGLKKKGAGRFFYPKKGYGQISEAYYQAALEAEAEVKLGATVSGIKIEEGQATSVFVNEGHEEKEVPAHFVLSTIPLTLLAQMTRPEPPQEVLKAADTLKYRAMLLIYLVLDTEQFTEFDAHYFPEKAIPITRLSEPKNYGLAQLPGTTVLCAELPCSTEDDVWHMTDEELGALVVDSLGKAQLPVEVPLRRVVTRRLSHAYPIYECGYQEHFETLDKWADGIEGLLTLGRQGLFVHDNTHHTLAMGYAAGDCITPQGAFDRDRWLGYRREFETNVVED